MSASVVLRREQSLEALGHETVGCLLDLFDPSGAFFWHVADGRLELVAEHRIDPAAAEVEDEVYAEFLARIRPFDPEEVRRLDLVVHHASQLMALRPAATADSFRDPLLRDAAVGPLLACHLFDEQGLFLGCAGVFQVWDEPDFGPDDWRAMAALHPHLEAALRAGARRARRGRYGALVAEAVEAYPQPVLIYGGDPRRLLYANRAARDTAQAGDADGGRVPLVGWTPPGDAVGAWLRGEGPCPEGVLSMHALPDWERAGVGAAVMVVLATSPGRSAGALDGGVLTARQRELLAAAAASNGELARAAGDLGITVATVRTHLKHIYRRLGVGGLTEALVWWHLQQGGS